MSDFFLYNVKLKTKSEIKFLEAEIMSEISSKADWSDEKKRFDKRIIQVIVFSGVCFEVHLRILT